jgi:hypothetical protein
MMTVSCCAGSASRIREAEKMIDDYAADCRKVLHPAEVDEWRPRRRRRLRR